MYYMLSTGTGQKDRSWPEPFTSGSGHSQGAEAQQNSSCQSTRAKSPFQAAAHKLPFAFNPWADSSGEPAKEEASGPRHLLPGLDSIWAPKPSKSATGPQATFVRPAIHVQNFLLGSAQFWKGEATVESLLQFWPRSCVLCLLANSTRNWSRLAGHCICRIKDFGAMVSFMQLMRSGSNHEVECRIGQSPQLMQSLDLYCGEAEPLIPACATGSSWMQKLSSEAPHIHV